MSCPVNLCLYVSDSTAQPPFRTISSSFVVVGIEICRDAEVVCLSLCNILNKRYMPLSFSLSPTVQSNLLYNFYHEL